MVAVVIAIIACFTPVGQQTVTHGGQVMKDSYGAILDVFTGDIFDATTSFRLNGTVFFSSAGLVNNTLTEKVTTGSCSTASSTIFSVPNPFLATSTLTYGEVYGTNGATTTDLLVATSSTPYITNAAQTATSSIGANIMNLAAVTALSQFFSVIGITLGPAGGYKNSKGIPSSVSGSVVVGPGDSVVGFSTSTAPTGSGGQAAGQISVPTSCTYKFKWNSQ